MITSLKEKKEGLRHLEHDRIAFNQMIEDIVLIDIEIANRTFTWNNRKGGHHHITCHLDHFLVAENIIMEG